MWKSRTLSLSLGRTRIGTNPSTGTDLPLVELREDCFLQPSALRECGIRQEISSNTRKTFTHLGEDHGHFVECNTLAGANAEDSRSLEPKWLRIDKNGHVSIQGKAFGAITIPTKLCNTHQNFSDNHWSTYPTLYYQSLRGIRGIQGTYQTL